MGYIRFLIVAVIASVAAMLAVDALALPVCGEITKMKKHLLERWGETVTVTGLTPNGYLFMILSNDKTGSWTALYQSPSGLACTQSAGEAFSIVQPNPAEDTPELGS